MTNKEFAERETETIEKIKKFFLAAAPAVQRALAHDLMCYFEEYGTHLEENEEEYQKFIKEVDPFW